MNNTKLRDRSEHIDALVLTFWLIVSGNQISFNAKQVSKLIEGKTIRSKVDDTSGKLEHLITSLILWSNRWCHRIERNVKIGLDASRRSVERNHIEWYHYQKKLISWYLNTELRGHAGTQWNDYLMHFRWLKMEIQSRNQSDS
jgi:hypothetical protein